MDPVGGPGLRRRRFATAFLLVALLGPPAGAEKLAGRVVGASGAPVEGVMLTLRRSGGPSIGDLHETTVFSDAEGRFGFSRIAPQERLHLRARRIGWRQRTFEAPWPADSSALRIELEREVDPARVADQLPADRWLALLHERIGDPGQQENFVRRCIHCHQQGSPDTRRPRDPAAWATVLDRMQLLGAVLEPELRAVLPDLLAAAYDPRTAVPALTRGMEGDDFAPPVPRAVGRAVIDEWELGRGESMQHDIVVHPDGRVYSVDMLQDLLYSIDPNTEDGDAREYPIPHPAGFRIGGVVAGPETILPPGFNAYVAPHSLQVDSRGTIWLTLSYGNRLASFDPVTEQWKDFPLGDEVLYPHTLRIDERNRIWYTLMLSNHIGMFDIGSGEHRAYAIPARESDPPVPTPYGLDVHPLDGSVWFSQLEADHIGRLDPRTGEIEMIETPFPAPRRLRFDSRGHLWIPSFSSDRIVRRDAATGEFEYFPLPTPTAGTDAAYSLTVDRRTDDVWISTTNTDTLVRLRPAAPTGQRYTVFPLPTRVTYTREIDFDARGRVYSSNSNLPLRQIEGGRARIIRLDPRE